MMSMVWFRVMLFFFFFNDTATTEIYTLSLHDALPISAWSTAVTNDHGGAYEFTSKVRSEEHTSELQSHSDLVCRLLLEKKKRKDNHIINLKTETNNTLKCKSSHDP